MKAALFDSAGKKKSDISLPAVFSTPVREDIVAKAVELAKFAAAQPHSLYKEAGKRHSASGTISHKRHEWKGHYGKGLARVPRKTMNRHGTQFYWVATEVSGTRGGRRVHGPTLWKKYRKINDKEAKFALASALAATANSALIQKRYSSLTNAPAVLPIMESIPQKSALLVKFLENSLGDAFSVAESKSEVRSGKGKMRGRTYKSNAGALIVVGNKETHKFKSFDVKSVRELSILDLYPLGRLTIYTKQALEDLQNA